MADTSSGGDPTETPEERLARLRAAGLDILSGDTPTSPDQPPAPVQQVDTPPSSADLGTTAREAYTQLPYPSGSGFSGAAGGGAGGGGGGGYTGPTLFSPSGQAVAGGDQYAALQALGGQPPPPPTSGPAPADSVNMPGEPTYNFPTSPSGPANYPGEPTQNPTVGTPPNPFPSTGGTGTTPAAPTVGTPTTGSGGGIPGTPGPTPTGNTGAAPTGNTGGPKGAVTPIVEGKPAAGGSSPGGGTGGTPTGNTGAGSPADVVTQQLMGQLSSLQDQVNNPQAPADVGLLYQNTLTSLLQMIDQEMASAREEAQKAGTSVDPATEFTLSKMREELDRQLTSQQQALNARGLYDSGILAKAEIDLRKGNLSDQAQVLSTRLSKIQDDLQKQLTSLRGTKVNLASEFGLKGTEAQVNENNRAQSRQDDLQKMLLNTRLGLRNQLSDEQISREKMASDARLRQAEIDAQNARSQNEINAANQRAQAENDLQRQLEQMRLGASRTGSSGSGSTALGGGTAQTFVNGDGTTVHLYNDGTTSIGQKTLQDMQAHYGTDKEAMVNAIQQYEDTLRQRGLTDQDINRLYQNAMSGPEGADITGITHGH